MVPEQREILEGVANYNDQIFKKFSEISKPKWNQSLKSTVDNFASYDKKFNGPAFKHWLIRETPLTIDSEETLGSYLKRNNKLYLEKYPDGKAIEDIVSEVPNELRKISKACLEDRACREKKIAAMVTNYFKSTCLGKHPKEAITAMLTSIAAANVGYGMSTSKHPENGYPYDLMLTNLIWTPIMASVGCRNTLEGGSIGNKVDFGQTVRFSTENAKIKVNNYINYMILSPLSNATYVGFHTVKQLYKGEKDWKDIHMLDLAKQVGSITLYDAWYVTPRMMFFTDPLYLKGIPSFGRYLNGYMGPVPAAGIKYGTDWFSRGALSFVNTEALNWWLAKSDGWWDTKFAGDEKKPSSTVNPQNKGPNEKDKKAAAVVPDADSLPMIK